MHSHKIVRSLRKIHKHKQGGGGYGGRSFFTSFERGLKFFTGFREGLNFLANFFELFYKINIF